MFKLRRLILLTFLYVISGEDVYANFTCTELFLHKHPPTVFSAVDGDAIKVSEYLRQKQDILLKQDGYKSYHDLERKIRTSNNALIVQNLKYLSDDSLFDFATNAPAKARDSISKKGFLNQHATNTTSSAFLDHETRNQIEASYLAIGTSSYRILSPFLKPKYGYLRPKDSMQMTGYGNDLYTFKKEKVKSKLSFTLGDSLGTLIVSNNPVQKFNDKASIPEKWSQVFTPWSRMSLLAPFLKIENDALGIRLKNDELSDFPLKSSAVFKDYVELQFWGNLSFDDVESFGFTKSPPKGNFLNRLVAKNIKIYDMTSGKPKLWLPAKVYNPQIL